MHRCAAATVTRPGMAVGGWCTPARAAARCPPAHECQAAAYLRPSSRVWPWMVMTRERGPPMFLHTRTRTRTCAVESRPGSNATACVISAGCMREGCCAQRAHTGQGAVQLCARARHGPSRLQRPHAPVLVEVYPLPCAQRKAALGHRHRQAGTHQGALAGAGEQGIAERRSKSK